MNNISKINLYCQKLKISNPCCFETLSKKGDDHCPTFQVSCTFKKQVEIGEGSTLKIAKELAAEKIVKLLNIDQRLKELDNGISYDIDSYNAPLRDIWENETKTEYILTLKKKDKKNKTIDYKKFKVQINQVVE
jgi:Double-stranded RNA binding motif